MKSLLKLNIVAVCAFTTVAAFAVDATPKTVTVDGWISETGCGAEHASVKGANPGCVAKCIKEGAKPVFVDDAKQQVWSIDNPDAVKDHYGHHVKFTGTEDADQEGSAYHQGDHARRPGCQDRYDDEVVPRLLMLARAARTFATTRCVRGGTNPDLSASGLLPPSSAKCAAGM